MPTIYLWVALGFLVIVFVRLIWPHAKEVWYDCTCSPEELRELVKEPGGEEGDPDAKVEFHFSIKATDKARLDRMCAEAEIPLSELAHRALAIYDLAHHEVAKGNTLWVHTPEGEGEIDLEFLALGPGLRIVLDIDEETALLLKRWAKVTESSEADVALWGIGIAAVYISSKEAGVEWILRDDEGNEKALVPPGSLNIKGADDVA